MKNRHRLTHRQRTDRAKKRTGLDTLPSEHKGSLLNILISMNKKP